MEATIDYGALSSFADQVRESAGWLTYQCAERVSAAVSSASGAMTWPDSALHYFGVKWDQEISLVSDAIANYAAGILDVIAVYKLTDDRVAGK